MHKRIQFFFALVTVFTLVLATPASASSSVVHDPSGDSVAEPYTDITMAKVTAQSGRDTFYFQMVLATPVPSAPSRSGAYNGFTAYNWLIDLDGNGIANYVVVVRFCSHLVQGPCVGDEWHWESALTEEKISRLNSPDVADRIKTLTQQIDAKKAELEQKDKEYQQYAAGVTKSDRSGCGPMPRPSPMSMTSSSGPASSPRGSEACSCSCTIWCVSTATPWRSAPSSLAPA